MIGIYEVQNIAVLFFAVLGIVYIVYYISKKAGPVKAGKEKTKIYACGEDASPENLNVFESGFFRSAGKILGIEHIKDAHNGDLSRYLTWIFIGMTVLIIVMVMLW